MKLRPIILLSFVMLTACHATPDNRYYALTPSEPAAAQQPATPISWVLSSVMVPGMLDRPQVMIKSGQNQVRMLEYDRWAESLDSMVPRVLAGDLMARMGQGGAAAAAMDTRRISVTMDEFDADQNGQVVLSATWVVRTGSATQELLASHAFRKNETVDSHDINAVAAAMSRLLGALADAIASGQ